MRKQFQKSTAEEISIMRELYKKDLSLSEIGRRVKKNRTTIFYWIKKKGDYLPNRKPLPRKEQIKIPNPCSPEKIEEKTKEQEMKFCLMCGKEKQDLKWQKTKYCSLNCWDWATSKQNKQNWWMRDYIKKLK